MKIPRKLRRKDEDALLIVSGKQSAAFYHVYGSHIDFLDSFVVAKPEYTDFEGEFKVRGRGINVSSGSIKETDDESIIRHFLRELKLRMHKQSFHIAKIYLLAPAQTKNKIRQALPSDSRDKVKSIISGNFSRFHPLDLLKRLYAETTPP
jgi:hypothetical protein